MTTARIRFLLPATALGLFGLVPLLSAATVSSAPFGVIAADAPVGLTGISLPLIADDLFAGRISANTSTSVSFEAVSGGIGTRLTAGDRYYLEIVSGPLEGERFDLDTAGTIASANGTVTINLAADSHSTSQTLGSNVLVAARAVVRPHMTLAKLAATFSPALVGNNNPALADGVRIMRTDGFALYYLRGDNQSWREPGKVPDVRGTVIPPDTSVIVQLRSGAKKWTHVGTVRRNAFRKNLVSGIQSFATGFPLDLSPVQIGAFVDTTQASGLRWVGSDDPARADTIKIFDSVLGDFKTYYLRADGSSWSPVGDPANVASSSLIKAPSMVAITRTNPDPAHIIVPPFTP